MTFSFINESKAMMQDFINESYAMPGLINESNNAMMSAFNNESNALPGFINQANFIVQVKNTFFDILVILFQIKHFSAFLA